MNYCTYEQMSHTAGKQICQFPPKKYSSDCSTNDWYQHFLICFIVERKWPVAVKRRWDVNHCFLCQSHWLVPGHPCCCCSLSLGQLTSTCVSPQCFLTCHVMLPSSSIILNVATTLILKTLGQNKHKYTKINESDEVKH